MPRKPKDIEVPPSLHVPGMRAVNLELKPVEDEQEKELRLHKERYNFWIKEVGTYAFGIAFLVAIACYCFWALFDRSTTLEERRYVWSAVSAVMGAIVGTFFGRSTKS
jgi:hypothetical protein